MIRIKDNIYNLLIWCSAADREILELEECKPAEQIKHASIGVLLVITASIAGVAGGYMFMLILQNVISGIVFGIVWGVIFFFIDRSVVSSIRKKKDRFGKDLLLAFPRIFLACLAATFVSYGMDLKFFESDIDLEISDHGDSLLNSYINQNNTYLSSNFDNNIVALKKEVNSYKENLPVELQIIIKDYNLAQENYATLSKALNQTNANYYQQIRSIKAQYFKGDEISTSDNSKIYTLNNQIRKNNLLLQDQQQSLDSLNSLKENRIRIHQASTDSLEKKNSRRIKQIELERDSTSLHFHLAEEDKQVLHKNNNKLSARIASLDRLTSFATNYSNWKTSWQLFLLFFSIELLPIITKLCMWRGPYDFILEAKEHLAEQKIKIKMLFSDSDEFSNIVSYATRFEAKSKSQFEKTQTIYKNVHQFLTQETKQHNQFIKFAQNRFSEISKLQGSLDDMIKEKEIKTLHKDLDLFYDYSDKAFDEFNKDDEKI
ncbi:MAG TPA: DUF4407 domain-containing protein [Bacteroidia bacterium]|nr:DUF4407 domain-containing protein [Bacteroidia bacterium]